jgi:hypothetical protein
VTQGVVPGSTRDAASALAPGLRGTPVSADGGRLLAEFRGIVIAGRACRRAQFRGIQAREGRLCHPITWVAATLSGGFAGFALSLLADGLGALSLAGI